MEQGRPKFLLDAAGKGRKKRLGGLQSNEMDQALGQPGEVPAERAGLAAEGIEPGCRRNRRR